VRFDVAWGDFLGDFMLSCGRVCFSLAIVLRLGSKRPYPKQAAFKFLSFSFQIIATLKIVNIIKERAKETM